MAKDPEARPPAGRRRGKKSEYSMQLQEKQKAKYTYGILERQFEKMFAYGRQQEGHHR